MKTIKLIPLSVSIILVFFSCSSILDKEYKSDNWPEDLKAIKSEYDTIISGQVTKGMTFYFMIQEELEGKTYREFQEKGKESREILMKQILEIEKKNYNLK